MVSLLMICEIYAHNFFLFYGIVFSVSVFAEHLCARLLIFKCVRVLSWWGVAPTSVPLRNAIKRSCLQRLGYTYVSIALQPHQQSHSRDIKVTQNCGESEEERATRRHRAKMQPLYMKYAVKSMSTKERTSTQWSKIVHDHRSLPQHMLYHPSHTSHTLLHLADHPKSTCHAY